MGVNRDFSYGFKDLICNLNASIKSAMTSIDANSKGIIMVVDDEKHLCGILTDGDIRRSLLSGYGLKDPVDKVMNKEYIYAFNDEDTESLSRKIDHRISFLPIVDRNRHLVDYFEVHRDTHISLASPHLNGNEYQYLMDAFLSTWISSAGKYVTRFEEEFSSYCGMKHGVATSNGTTALHLALLSLGIGEGDEVIVPDLTFAATINAVIYTGATPVIVDIEKDSWCIDPKCVKVAITEKTRAIIPVHLYGQPCDMDKICELAEKHNLYIVEDCAEAHGAKWKDKNVGSFGVVSCFSFYGNKVITTGEGGMCLTNDSALDEKMRIYRDHGMRKERRYYHEVIGYNYRMTNMQAAIGVAQVEKLDEILEWRKSLEERYRKSYDGNIPVIFQRNDLQNRTKIAWLVSVLVDASIRDTLVEKLKANSIDVRSFFVPLHRMDIYKNYANGGCPVADEVSKRGINLPTTYDVDDNTISRVWSIFQKV